MKKTCTYLVVYIVFIAVALISDLAFFKVLVHNVIPLS